MILTPAAHVLIACIAAMGVLHLVMLVWMYTARVMALLQARISARKATPDALRKLPDWARNPAANYNHLSEAPPLFYAIVLAIIVLGKADGAHAECAVAFVVLRVVHSLLQATVNIIAIRAIIFAASWVALGVMIVRLAVQFC